MEESKKLHLIKDENLEDKSIFELADTWYISRIVHQISSSKKLEDIEKELSKR
jgi:hypothetical protein